MSYRNKTTFMKKSFFTLVAVIVFSSFFNIGKSQISIDSASIYYGLTQKETTKPLNDYFIALEKQGAKLQKVKKEYIDRIKTFYASTSAKKYKKGKHKGTIYFLEAYIGGKKELLVFESSLEKGVLINITAGQQFILSDKKSIDELYYLLAQIH